MGTLPHILGHSTNPLVHHSSESEPFPLNVGWIKDMFCNNATSIALILTSLLKNTLKRSLTINKFASLFLKKIPTLACVSPHSSILFCKDLSPLGM
jgi:hypothetical protein